MSTSLLAAGTLLGRLLAVDPQGQTVTYASPSSVVSVEAQSGVVRLSQALDREVRAKYVHFTEFIFRYFLRTDA